MLNIDASNFNAVWTGFMSDLQESLHDATGKPNIYAWLKLLRVFPGWQNHDLGIASAMF